VYHSPTDLRRLLAAALRHDAATFVATREEHAGATLPGGTVRFPSVAPFAAFLLLTGCRLGEALSVRWADVDLDTLDSNRAEVGEFRLRASDVKTRRARVVDLEVSPALRKNHRCAQAPRRRRRPTVRRAHSRRLHGCSRDSSPTTAHPRSTGKAYARPALPT